MPTAPPATRRFADSCESGPRRLRYLPIGSNGRMSPVRTSKKVEEASMRFMGWPALVAGSLGLLFLVLSGSSRSADDAEKELREGLAKLAVLIEKKDEAGAKKLVEELAKKFDMESIMF